MTDTYSKIMPEVLISHFNNGFSLSIDGVTDCPRDLIADDKIRRAVMNEAKKLCGFRTTQCFYNPRAKRGDWTTKKYCRAYRKPTHDGIDWKPCKESELLESSAYQLEIVESSREDLFIIYYGWL